MIHQQASQVQLGSSRTPIRLSIAMQRIPKALVSVSKKIKRTIASSLPSVYSPELQSAILGVADVEITDPEVEKAALDRDSRLVVEKALEYAFTDHSLLSLAFLHSSSGGSCSARLAFLGDTALHLAASEILMGKFPSASPGDVSVARAKLVRRTACARYARKLGIDKYMVVGKCFTNQNVPLQSNMAAELYEAVLGAVYIDGGYNPVKRIVERAFRTVGRDINSITSS